MVGNVIAVNVFDKVEIKEDQTTEFKTSIFVDPETHKPGFRQMMTIAETLAAFMNADGGVLYVGISDDKRIFGIEGDLLILKNHPEAVIAKSARGNDETFTYGGNPDKYELKIRAIVKAYLSPNASECLGEVRFAKMGEKLVCRIEVKKCRSDGYVYVYRKYGPTKPEVAEIYRRFGNQKRKIEGFERDEFVRQREAERHKVDEIVIDKLVKVIGGNAEDLKRRLLSLPEATARGNGPLAVGEKSLVDEIKAALAKAAHERKTHESGVDYKVFLDLESSTMEIMDNFQCQENGRYKYARMMLGKLSPPFASLPYCKSANRGYKKIVGVDFELGNLFWIVERTALTAEEASIIASQGRMISITEMKKNNTNDIQRFAWSQIVDQVRGANFGDDMEFMFKDVFLFKANTTETWAHGRPGQNLFQVVGLKCTKTRLRDCPDTTEGMEWWPESKLIRGVN